MKANDSRGIYVYLLDLKYKIHIHEVKHENWQKQVQMRKSSKLGYTCAYSEYKWTMKCKRIWIKCYSLHVHVYTQVLTKTTSKQVFTTWNTKQEHAKNHQLWKHVNINEE